MALFTLKLGVHCVGPVQSVPVHVCTFSSVCEICTNWNA